ncbi:MAG: dTDP-4-dehydrorhamnose reductase [Sulfitobacter sp.]
MSILVFGKSGQVAHALAKYDGVVCLDQHEGELTQPEMCARVIMEHRPDAVINAAAYTAVDPAEADEAVAQVVNGDAPAAMAKAAAELGIPMVQISTDYVFDGTGTDPWQPYDTPAPRSAYGRTKLAGETGVIAAKGVYGIVRTSWVFSAQGNNFVKTMLRLGAERDELNIVADQIGGPTWAGDVAEACYAMAVQLQESPDKSGTYHYSCGPDVSWADFARAIFEASGTTCQVNDIPSSAYPTPAERPENSRLDVTSMTKTFGLKRPDWRVALNTVLQELK